MQQLLVLNKTKSCPTIPWNKLKTYEFNALKEAKDRDVTKLKNSIVNDGFRFPMFIWADHKFVIDGAGRDKALLELEAEGYQIEDVPVVEIEAENKREAKMLALQASSKYGDITEQSYGDFTLDMELTEPDFGKFDLGLDFSMPEAEELPPVEEDEAPEPQEDPTTKMGDIWLCGNHRVMCGDSTAITDVDKLMNGEKAQLLHADPPYGMKKENDGVLNDNLNSDDLCQFQMDWWNTFRSSLVDNASAYIWGNAEELWKLWFNGLAESERLTFRNEIAWGKPGGMGIGSDQHRMYPTVSERCLFFMLGEQGFNNNADNYWEGWDKTLNYLKSEKEKSGYTIKELKKIAGHSENSGCHWFDKSQWMMPTRETYEAWQQAANGDAFEKDYDAFEKDYDELKQEHDELKQEHDELKKEFYATRAYFDNTHENMTDVWEYGRVKGEERHGHATPKPVEMMGRIMKSSLPKDGLCIEPFGGSGSTLIAAEQTKRKCYTMELDPRYCDVIVKRYIKLTGNEAILEGTQEIFPYNKE